MVGSPASGKSRICYRYLPSYIRINQDTLKNIKKCLDTARKELNNGNSIIVHNTNRYLKVRQLWIDLAKEYKIPIDCIHVDITRNMALHFNSYRQYLNKDNCNIPDMAIYSYFTQKEGHKMEVPTPEEGYRNLITLHVDNHYDDNEDYDTLCGYIRDTYHASYILD